MPSTSVLCWLAAVTYMATSGLMIAEIVVRSNTWTDNGDYTELEPDNIEITWDDRYDNKSLFYASGFMNGFFWIIFSIPICELAWILSRSGTQAIGWTVGICVFAIGGAMTEWLTHLFWIGTTVGSFTLAYNFNLDQWLRPDVAASLGVGDDDGVGWSDLELNHIIVSGMIWIVDSFEWLCLSGIFTFSFVSVYIWRQTDQSNFGPRWNALGLFIGLLAAIEFAMEIVRFEGYNFASPIVLLYAVLNRIILIPAWTISLGFQLPRASATHFDSYVETEPFLSEHLSKPGKNNAPTFTIDDDDAIANGSGLQSPSLSTSPSGPSSPPAEAFAANPMFLTGPNTQDS